jgi:threonine/homoserine/homoserine lactone efflux protein
MFDAILIGSGFAFAAAIQPGPLTAFLLDSVARRGWKRTLPASLAPMISDIPIAALVLIVLTKIPPIVTVLLRIAGGFFMLYLAVASYRQWKAPASLDEETAAPAPRTLLQAILVNILNPNPYIGWSLVLGPAVLAEWEKSPVNGTALVVAFYLTMALVLAFTIRVFGVSSRLGPAGRKNLVLVSSILLAALGAYQLAVGSVGIKEAFLAGLAAVSIPAAAVRLPDSFAIPGSDREAPRSGRRIHDRG